MTKITTDNYWISPRALSIQLNAMGDADHIQASVAAGAQILCYVKGVEGLEYDAGHNYRHWPLRISPTYFPTETHKYVCVAIPRSEEVGTEAIVSFPDEELDIYGMNEAGEQVGNEDYYYVWLQGIISGHIVESGYTFREWEEPIDTGRLNSDEAYDAGGDGTWWKLLADGTVDFIKTINHAVFNFLEAAQATIHNLNVTGTLDAIKGYIDDLRSHNYQSGLLDGSGFRLTNDNGEGGSELEIDFLKVRKKATFMELEIREETFVGGNNHYSPAGSVIYRVEYMDENDKPIGYTVMKVPFLLKRFAFLGRLFNYAARKRIRRQLTTEEWRTVHHFRCYLLADDGTTATRNWWKVGDQPRCQTFNKAISAQNKRNNTYNWKKDHFNDDPATPMPDYTTIEGPFETAYYWRLCSNVGSEKLDDGHVYDFIDMPYEGWSGYSETDKRSFRDAGSGIPVAGDTIVCIGNRTDESRMNTISLYTSGADNNPPAIKGRRGIHTFSFENTLVWEMSPEQFLVRSKSFKLFDDSGYQFPVPLERGEWQRGTRYHWYDRVSWAGCIWLCQVLDVYVWENATGTEYQQYQVEDIEYGEGNFQYSAVIGSDEIVTGTDHYYARGKVNGQTVYKIKLYTYSEPDKNNDLWLREVDKGRNGIDGDGVEFVYVRTTEKVAPYISNSSDTYDGKTYLDDDYLPLAKVSSGRIKGITEGNANVAVRCTDDPIGPTKEWPFEWVAKRVMGDPNTETGERRWNKYNERIGIAGGEMSQWSTYTENSVRLDLSNEMDMLQTDKTGRPVVARTVTTVARLFDGTSEIQIVPRDLTVTGGDLTPTKVADPDSKGVLLTWRFSPTAYRPMTTAWEIIIAYTYKNEEYKAEFTIAPSLGQDIWQLKPDMSSIPFQRDAANALTPASRNVGLKLVWMDHDNTQEYDSTTGTGVTVRYAFDAMPASSSAGTGWTSGAITVANDKTNLYIALFNSSGVMLDRETIPVIKDGVNGANTVRIDLDNENDSMLYTGDGTLVSGNVTSTAYMFDGATDVSGSTTFSISAREGVTAQQATISGRVITVTGMNAATAKVTVQGVYTDGQNKTHTKIATLSLKKIVDGDKYELVITPNSIAYNATTDKPATSTLSIQVWKTSVNSSGGATRALSAPPTGYGVYAGTTVLTASSTGTYSYTTDNSAITEVQVKIAKGASSTDILDAETVPVTKAENGQSSFTSHVFKRQNTQPATPTGGSYSSPVPSGWSDGVPDGTAMVWMSTRIFSSDGKAPQQSAWTTPRQMTDTADFDVEFSSVANPNPPSGHPNTNTQWSNTSDSSTIWMATSECHNGIWSDWQVARIKGEQGIQGVQGPQGDYELIQYARSSSYTSHDDAYIDGGASGWQSTAPLPSVYYPAIWKRSIMYDPSTGSTYGSYSYVCLSGEKGAKGDKGDDGQPGAPGKTGLWYRYAGVWNVDVSSVTNTDTVGYYVKYGASFYMNVKDSGVANTTTPGGTGWELMTSVFEYFMTKVTFADSAYLGSFIINGDWMISQYGKVNGNDSSSYQRFNPNDMSSASAFIPNFAVDGKTGKVYANDFQTNGVGGAYVKINSGSESQSSSETNVTILDTKGLYSRGSQDGFRMIHNSSGVQLQRWNPIKNMWVSFYAGRCVRQVFNDTTVSVYDDYLLGTGVREITITLPSIGIPEGKTISIKAMGKKITVSGSLYDHQSQSSMDLNDYDRAELVYFGGFWYWNFMSI